MAKFGAIVTKNEKNVNFAGTFNLAARAQELPGSKHSTLPPLGEQREREGREGKMSFGKLNILMHKSWNVWNRDNVEKVLRDERLHREEESKKRQRTDEVESESRTQLLRAKRAAAAESGADVGGAAAGPSAGAQPALLSLADKFSAPESAPRTEGGGMPVAACTGAGQGVGDSGSAASSAHRGFSIFAGLEHELDAAAGNDTAQG